MWAALGWSQAAIISFVLTVPKGRLHQEAHQ
jgi:hypothetical protein